MFTGIRVKIVSRHRDTHIQVAKKLLLFANFEIMHSHLMLKHTFRSQ